MTSYWVTRLANLYFLLALVLFATVGQCFFIKSFLCHWDHNAIVLLCAPMMPLITVGSVSLCVRGALVHNRYWRTLRIALAAWFDRVPIGPKVCALSASVGAKIVKHSLTMKLFFCFQRWTQVFAWASIYCALGCKLKLGCKQLTQA